MMDEGPPRTSGDRFAALLPSWVPPADRAMDENDERFEDFDWWAENPDDGTLAVRIGNDGQIYYASLFNDKTKYNGKGHVHDGLPADVLAALRRLFPVELING